MDHTASAGNFREKVRSDCKVSLALKDSGGIIIDLQSKVKSMFGQSIIKLVKDIFRFFDIEHAEIEILDSGALPYVIAARIEAAIKKVSNTNKEFLLPAGAEQTAAVLRDRFRMSRLYLPGNTPSMAINAGVHHPDGIILDLEDSVAPDKKDEARFLVRNTLRAVDFYAAEKMVRINQLPLGLEDAAIVIPHGVDTVLLPKCEEVWQIQKLEEVIRSALDTMGIQKDIWLMPIIESALGVENAFQLARASKNVVALAIGLEDYTADLGVVRTEEGRESLYARTRIVNACKAAGIQPIDSVYSDVDNPEGLAENVRMSRSLGFEGMGCIHPGQIRIIHEGFKPTEDEIERARKIVEAYQEARKQGLGVVALGSKMIDAPVVKRAEQTISLALKFNLIEKQS